MLAALVRSLRPAQWTKNFFVLAPLVFAQKLTDPVALGRALEATALFCLISGAIYLINDIWDREEDRRHPLKAKRPIASGELPVPVAAGAAVALASGALAGAWLALGPRFALLLVAYLTLTLLYTVWLKDYVILDVMIIALGFYLRVLSGAVAIEVTVSPWLALCTIFLALFLAFSKRRHELMLLAEAAPEQRSVLSHYNPRFLDQMINVVTASAVVGYALYTVEPETVERLGTPHLVYTVPMVMFGIFRYLYLMYRRTGNRNPTEKLLTDVPSLLNLLAWALSVTAIIYWS